MIWLPKPIQICTLWGIRESKTTDQTTCKPAFYKKQCSVSDPLVITSGTVLMFYPTASIYGIRYIQLYLPTSGGTIFYHYKQPNVGKYTSLMDGMGIIFNFLVTISTSWWLNQPIWNNMLVKMGSSSPRFGVKIKHALVFQILQSYLLRIGVWNP